jgi:hypothetical protein
MNSQLIFNPSDMPSVPAQAQIEMAALAFICVHGGKPIPQAEADFVQNMQRLGLNDAFIQAALDYVQTIANGDG